EKSKKTGHSRYIWKLPSGQRNEALDMMNQAHAAAIRLGVTYWTDEEWDLLADRLSKAEQPVQTDIEDLLMPVPEKPETVAPRGQMTPRCALASAAHASAERARQRNSGGR